MLHLFLFLFFGAICVAGAVNLLAQSHPINSALSLIAVMGGLCVANGNADTYKLGVACKPSAAPLGAAVFGLHDGVDQAGAKVKANGPLLPTFPYIGTPLPGAK